MIKYRLGDIVYVISEREDNPGNCKYDKFVGLEHYTPGEVEIKNYGNTDLLISAMKVFCAGDILIARRNVYLKRASVVNFDGITSGDSIVLRAKDEILKRLLPFVLNTDNFWEYAEKFSDGTMSKRLSPKILLEYEFSLPDIKKQEKLAEILWAANDNKVAYKRLLSLTDDLVRSQFIEMFRSGNYPIVKTEDICDFITKGTTPPTDEIFEQFNIGYIPYIKVYNLSFSGQMLFDEQPQYVSEETHSGILARSKVYPNDVLMNIVGPPLGKFAIVPEAFPEWNINQAIAIFRAKEQVMPMFLLHALMQPDVLKPFLEKAVGIRQLNLSLQQCRELQIPLPPISEQNKFVDFVKQADKSKLELQQTISSLENTVKSLMKQYVG